MKTKLKFSLACFFFISLSFSNPLYSQQDSTSDEQLVVKESHLNEIIVEDKTLQELHPELEESDYVQIGSIDVEEVIVPVEETQTVVSYNKKGEAEAAFQVIHDPETHEIRQIVFMDKNHRDIYDVQAGMSGEEVKKLRKELKHMEHHGKIFLYDENSNLMYLMDAKDFEGDEIKVEDVESMEVEAIIWKDKKHHKQD